MFTGIFQFNMQNTIINFSKVPTIHVKGEIPLCFIFGIKSMDLYGETRTT